MWVAIWISLALGLAGTIINATNDIDQDIRFSQQIEAARRFAEILDQNMKQLHGDFLKLLSEASKHSVSR